MCFLWFGPENTGVHIPCWDRTSKYCALPDSKFLDGLRKGRREIEGEKKEGKGGGGGGSEGMKEGDRGREERRERKG